MMLSYGGWAFCATRRLCWPMAIILSVGMVFGQTPSRLPFVLRPRLPISCERGAQILGLALGCEQKTGPLRRIERSIRKDH